MISRISSAQFKPSFGSVRIYRGEYEKRPSMDFANNVFLPSGVNKVAFVNPVSSTGNLGATYAREIVYGARQYLGIKPGQACFVNFENTCHIVAADLETEVRIKNAIQEQGYSPSVELIDDFKEPADDHSNIRVKFVMAGGLDFEKPLGIEGGKPLIEESKRSQGHRFFAKDE